MNRFVKILATSAAAVLFAIVTAGAANAGDHGHGGGYGGHYSGKKFSYGLAGAFGHLFYGGYAYRHNHRRAYAHGYRRHDNFGHRRQYSRRHRGGYNSYGYGGYGGSSGKRHGSGYRNDQTGYGAKAPAYAAKRPCHSTYKHGYAQGRKAKIGGTMCYDGYGNAYIVPGSRYVIAYY